MAIRTFKGLCIQKKGLDYQGLKNTGRESGGLMSSINGPRIFYFLPELYDVSCKAQCLCSVCESLQSDVYNVYMYLDNELMDIEHLCCLTHARAKFSMLTTREAYRQDFSLSK